MFGAKMLVRMNALITLEADVGQPRRMRVGRTQITRYGAAQYEFHLGRKRYRTAAVCALFRTRTDYSARRGPTCPSEPIGAESVLVARGFGAKFAWRISASSVPLIPLYLRHVTFWMARVQTSGDPAGSSGGLAQGRRRGGPGRLWPRGQGRSGWRLALAEPTGRTAGRDASLLLLVIFFGWHQCPAQWLEAARPPSPEDNDGDDT